MQTRKSARLHTVLIALLLAATTVADTAIPVYWSFDWDDNIFVMPTRLFVRNRQNHDDIVALSTADWREMRDQLGVSGRWKNYELFGGLADGSKRFMGDFQRNGNHFQKDIESGMQQPPDLWRGPKWDEFVAATGNEALAGHVTIITGRMHDPQTMRDGLAWIRDRKQMIRAVPPVENLYPVANPKITPGLAGTKKSPAEAKARIIHRLLDGIEAERLMPDAPMVLRRMDGKGRERAKIWSYSDDDFKNIRTVLDDLTAAMARAFASGRPLWPSVKIQITYTGPPRPDFPSATVVIQGDGRVRAASRDEAEEPLRLAHRIAASRTPHAYRQHESTAGH